jgi:hypothetical protein
MTIYAICELVMNGWQWVENERKANETRSASERHGEPKKFDPSQNANDHVV